MGRLTFGVRDHCVQRGRAGSHAPIPLLGLDAVFCWLVYVSSVLRTEILENSMIFTEVNEKEKLGRMSLPAVTPAVSVSSGPASQDALEPPQAPPPRTPWGLSGPASQDALGSLRPRLPGRPRVSQAPPPRTPRSLLRPHPHDSLAPPQAPPPGLSGVSLAPLSGRPGPAPSCVRVGLGREGYSWLEAVVL